MPPASRRTASFGFDGFRLGFGLVGSGTLLSDLLGCFGLDRLLTERGTLRAGADQLKDQLCGLQAESGNRTV